MAHSRVDGLTPKSEVEIGTERLQFHNMEGAAPLQARPNRLQLLTSDGGVSLQAGAQRFYATSNRITAEHSKKHAMARFDFALVEFGICLFARLQVQVSQDGSEDGNAQHELGHQLENDGQHSGLMWKIRN
jgi:hypothetical protein